MRGLGYTFVISKCSRGCFFTKTVKWSTCISAQKSMQSFENWKIILIKLFTSVLLHDALGYHYNSLNCGFQEFLLIDLFFLSATENYGTIPLINGNCVKTSVNTSILGRVYMRPEMKSNVNEITIYHKRNSVYFIFHCGWNETNFVSGVPRDKRPIT